MINALGKKAMKLRIQSDDSHTVKQIELYIKPINLLGTMYRKKNKDSARL